MNKNNFTLISIRKVLYSMIIFFIKVSRPIKKVIFKFKNKINKGNNEIYYCPCCNTYPKFWVPLNIYYYFKAKQYGYKYFGTGEMGAVKTFYCPNCFANDTERLTAYYIDKNIKINRIIRNNKLIHFAPEEALSKKLMQLNFINYVSADLHMKDVTYKVDLMNLPFENESFDCFICSHVLEHVESDDKAISELFRILNKKGFGILMAPISTSIEHTLEDPNIITEEERWKHFGQNDHLRLYSHNDYVNKLEKCGFKVNQLGINYFGREVFKQLGLKEAGILYVVGK